MWVCGLEIGWGRLGLVLGLVVVVIVRLAVFIVFRLEALLS